MSDAWENRLCKLIRKCASATLPAFGRDFHDEVVRLCSIGRLTQDDSVNLLRAGQFLGQWTAPTPPEPPVALDQWNKTYEPGRRLPSTILQAILSRLPENVAGRDNWLAFVLVCTDPNLIRVLLRQHRLAKSDLPKIAEAQPAAFYLSAALDVALEDSILGRWDAFWTESARGQPRPPGLMPPERAVVRWYLGAKGGTADQKFIAFLVGQNQLQERILRELFAHRAAVLRLCHYLASRPPKTVKAVSTAPSLSPQDLLFMLVARAGEQLDSADRVRASNASLVLATVRLGIAVRNPAQEQHDSSDLSVALRQGMGKAALQALRLAESGDLGAAGGMTLGMYGHELHESIREHLRQLPTDSRSGEQSPERALRHERFLGSKQVLEQIIAAIQKPLADGQLRDELEAALFNCGVQPIGAIGERVSFHSRLHEADHGSVVLPGEPASVIRPGRCLGDADDGLVLLKAIVQPMSDNSASRTQGDRDEQSENRLH